MNNFDDIKWEWTATPDGNLNEETLRNLYQGMPPRQTDELIAEMAQKSRTLRERGWRCKMDETNDGWFCTYLAPDGSQITTTKPTTKQAAFRAATRSAYDKITT